MNKFTFLTAFLFCFVLSGTGQTSDTASTRNSIRNSIPEQVKARKLFKRIEWFNTQRAWPSDTIPMFRYAHEMDREIKEVRGNTSKGNEDMAWTSIGPSGQQSHYTHWGQVSGRAKTIAVHPSDPLTLYIGAAHGGIWKTIDGGQTWLDIGHNLASLSFGAIAIDPNNPEIIYAGSGEVCYLPFYVIFDGKGIFKSTDGGNTWNQITNGIGSITSFGDLAVSPFNSNVVLGALASGNNYSGNLANEGLWKSEDAGESWVRTLDVQDAYDIAFHPTDANKVFAAIGGGNSDAGFYISTDQGTSWTQSNTGLPSTSWMHRLQIDVSQSNPDIIYAVIFDGNAMFTKAYKSVNGGANWAQISAGTNLGGYNGGWYDQGFYDLCIAVDPENPDLVYIGNVELHRTENGSTFAPVRPFGNDLWGGLAHADFHKLVFAPSNPDYFYIACDGGINKSTDKGYTAASQNIGLTTHQFYRVASHPLNPQIVIGGMQDNATAMTLDGGLTWNEVTGGDGMECLFNPGNPDTIYTSLQNGYFYRSVNGGNSFSAIYNANGSWTTPLIMHPTNHKILFTANRSVLKSTTGGASFQNIAPLVAPELIVDLAMSLVNPNNMIFASGGTHEPIPGSQIVVKISTDGGYNWTDVTSNIPGEARWITRVACDPVYDSTMYILRTGFSEGNKVWKSTNLGQTWLNCSGDLPDLPCSDLFIDPEYTGHLYVANDLGVYRSTDGGVTWFYASPNIPFVPAIDFDYVKIGNDRYLRVGTHGRSIYQALLPTSCLPEGITFTTQEEIDNFQINYPGCTEIEGDVTIDDGWSGSITNLNGLRMLISIGGSLYTYNNSALTSLSGLEGLTFIGEDLATIWNSSLTSLTGLENLTTIGGGLSISNNNSLTSLMEFENLTSIGGYLDISYNPLLNNCDAECICAYLSDPNGSVTITGNSAGCISLIKVAMDCGTIVPCLEQGTYSFNNQFDIDHFPEVFPGCTNIPCNIFIEGYDISNLDSLGAIISIGGDLEIIFNNSLTSLTGLENLTSIGGSFSISYNSSLTSLTGLENLTSIGGDLEIIFNNSLTSLAGLENLTSIGGGLSIEYNASLNSLVGLEGLFSIGGNLSISFNTALTSMTGLENLTSIGGNLYPYNNNSLNTLTGLENLTSIGGSLGISYNAALTSLSGLENLTSIGGGLWFYSNNSLTSLTELENLTSVGGNLYFYNNTSLTSMTGLENLTSVGGGLSFDSNASLNSLTGLEGLFSIVGDLSISINAALTSLTGLDNVTSIGGYVTISGNNALTSLTGLEDLTSIPGDLNITNNAALTSLTGLENLTSIGSGLYIENNNALTSLTGLQGLTSISWGLHINNNAALISLTGLENLTSIGGGLYIGNNNALTSLSGLEGLSSNGGTLDISDNDSLTSLMGLQGLTSIGGGLYIENNDALTSLTGLEDLSSMGGDLIIYNNNAMTSLSGMDGVASIGGYLEISSNNALTSLSGLDNINPGTIYNLQIAINSVLSSCEVQSICDYLANPNGSVTIFSNAPGCNSPEEVEAACLEIGIEEPAVGSQHSTVMVYPNPFDGSITFEYFLDEDVLVNFSILDHLGRQVSLLVNEKQHKGRQVVAWNAENLPPGVYYCRLKTGNQLISKKIIKMN